jgi:hypothetical protein
VAARVIELDGWCWRTPGDFVDAMKEALGAPSWHGLSFDALLDSMGAGSINEVEPPYELRIKAAVHWPPSLREFIADFVQSLSERTRQHLESFGERRDIRIILEE